MCTGIAIVNVLCRLSHWICRSHEYYRSFIRIKSKPKQIKSKRAFLCFKKDSKWILAEQRIKVSDRTQTFADMDGLFAFVFALIVLVFLMTIPFGCSHYSRADDITFTFHFSTIQYWLEKVLSTLYLSNFYFKSKKNKKHEKHKMLGQQQQKRVSGRSSLSLLFSTKFEYEFKTFIRFIESEVQWFFFSPFFLIFYFYFIWYDFFSASPFESLKIDQMLRKHKWHERNPFAGGMRDWKRKWKKMIHKLDTKERQKREKRNQRYQTEWIENCGGERHTTRALPPRRLPVKLRCNTYSTYMPKECHNQFPFSKQFNVCKSYSEYASRWLFLMPLLHNK